MFRLWETITIKFHWLYNKQDDKEMVFGEGQVTAEQQLHERERTECSRKPLYLSLCLTHSHSSSISISSCICLFILNQLLLFLCHFSWSSCYENLKLQCSPWKLMNPGQWHVIVGPVGEKWCVPEHHRVVFTSWRAKGVWICIYLHYLHSFSRWCGT